MTSRNSQNNRTAVRGVSFSNDACCVASVFADRQLTVDNLATAVVATQPLGALDDLAAPFSALRYSPWSRSLLTLACDDGSLVLGDVDRGLRLKTFKSIQCDASISCFVFFFCVLT